MTTFPYITSKSDNKQLDMSKKFEVLKYEEVIRREDEKLLERREKMTGKKSDLEELQKTKFGIALSGGGIRSATINLGFLKTLNKFGILKKADYLSTVSGGGYTGAYIQATLKNEKSYSALFAKRHIEYMRSRGAYMIPGQGWRKSWSTLVLTVGFLVSLVMSWISPLIVFLVIYTLYIAIGKLINLNQLGTVQSSLDTLGLLEYGLCVLGGVFVLHLIANLVFRYNVGVSRKFNNIEAILAGFGLLWLLVYMITSLRSVSKHNYSSISYYFIFIGLIIFVGFYANPNSLSFHRFYRNQLADAYLALVGKFKNVKIKDLFRTESSNVGDYMAPYPLINTCLNLQSTSDPKFKGAKASDYYLLSPLYCGAKLTGYVSTQNAPDYRDLTLPASTTISAAAVNPGMGNYSNKLLSVFMTVFNARLGFWIFNPTKINKSNVVWWPTYFFYELFSKIGTNNRMLNISDGGHIENLGVYELLRRKCRLIISVDAGADPFYTFIDLENLAIRARNELGLEIRFPVGCSPEDIIRPRPSHGYSAKRFAIGGVYQLWEEVAPEDELGNPILGKDGRPLEVLVNYKSIKDVLEILNKEERLQFRYALDTLDLKNYINDVLDQIKDPKALEAIYEQFDLNQNLQNVFKELVTVFNQIRSSLEYKLEHKLEDRDEERRVLRKVIEVIDEKAKNFLKVSTFVYVKSSVLAPERKLELRDRDSLDYKTYKYKVYHPAFPHEPTSDQFFDEIQWESYYRLGQFVGADVLGTDELMSYFRGKKEAPDFSFKELIMHFDEGIDLFDLVPEVPTTMERELQSPEAVKMGPPMAEDEIDNAVLEDYDESGYISSLPNDPEFDSIPQEGKIVVGGEDNYTM